MYKKVNHVVWEFKFSYRFFIFFLLVFISPFIFGDSAVLQSYMQMFSEREITAKAEVLRNAASDRRVNESIRQLYEFTLRYALDNYADMEDLTHMNNIIGITVKGLRNAGSSASIDILWELLLKYPVSAIKADILTTIGVLGKDNQGIINGVNNYLIYINSAFESESVIDYSLVSACITAITEMGDSSSYPVLFNLLFTGYPEVISSEIYGALDVIDGDLFLYIRDIMEKNPPEEKFVAFKAGINSRRLSFMELGHLAELALETGLLDFTGNADLIAMRYAAIQTLTSLRWTKASEMAVSYYHRITADYLQSVVSKGRLIESIACLGAIGDSSAALALGLQLGLINEKTKSTGVYDADITLAIVRALGSIGINTIFEHLLFTSNLSYNENIKTAAKEALDRLKW
ncbi:MAG: hypothetical protein LBC76_04165 [Treponema sp.]|jgi:hypothetical protein|nr:hypothetical protein [Treponema sp.]